MSSISIIGETSYLTVLFGRYLAFAKGSSVQLVAVFCFFRWYSLYFCSDIHLHQSQIHWNFTVSQLFYYESVSVDGPAALVPTPVPCLSSWGEEEITEREKRERDLGGYGFGEVIDISTCETWQHPMLMLTWICLSLLLLSRWYVSIVARIWSHQSTGTILMSHQHWKQALVLLMALSLNKKETR